MKSYKKALWGSTEPADGVPSDRYLRNLILIKAKSGILAIVKVSIFNNEQD